MKTAKKDLKYYRQNAEENYLTTPLSVLRYISELEKQTQTLQQSVAMGSVLEEIRTRLFESRQLTQSFDAGEARYVDGVESGLVTAIEVLEESLQLQQPPASGWVAVTDALPKALQTVWLTNGKGWCCLGCLIEDAEGWHWAKSNGVIYVENGDIVSECESEDLDVNYWHELPKPPCH